MYTPIVGTVKSLFYKPLKIKHPDEDIWISADLHCHQECRSWDQPLWHTRGYHSIQAHYEGVIKNWNSVVKDTSQAFLLGDSIFQKGGEERMMELFRRLNFHTLFICRGNHGSGWDSIFEKLPENILEIDGKTVVFCPNYFEAIINSQAVVFCHYFIASWNGQNSSKGASLMLHGHSHQSLTKGELADYIGRVRTMDVGIDATGYPFSFKEIKEKLLKITPYAPDHHSNKTANPF